MAIEMIGMAFKSMRWITGSFMSVGKSARMALILACASCWALLMRVPRRNSTTMAESPSVVVEEMWRTPEMVFKRLFDALGDFPLDGFRRRTGVERLYRQDGDLDVREHVDGELPVRENAERHQRHRQHGCQDGLFDGKVAQEHAATSRGWIRTPSAISNALLGDQAISRAASPSTISSRQSRSRPMRMFRRAALPFSSTKT